MFGKHPKRARLVALFILAGDYVCQQAKALNAYIGRSPKAGALICLALAPVTKRAAPDESHLLRNLQNQRRFAVRYCPLLADFLNI